MHCTVAKVGLIFLVLKEPYDRLSLPGEIGAGSDEEDAGTAAQREARAGMKDDAGGFSDSDGEDDRADRASNTDSFSGKIHLCHASNAFCTMPLMLSVGQWFFFQKLQ